MKTILRGQTIDARLFYTLPTGEKTWKDDHFYIVTVGSHLSGVSVFVTALDSEGTTMHGIIHPDLSDLVVPHRGSRRVQKNPGLVVYNPPEALIASDVQAIVYRHAEDGEWYCHSFGGGETEIEQDGDTLVIHDLAESTGVTARVKHQGKSVVLSHRNGLPVAQEF